jgi:hypothetical protein
MTGKTFADSTVHRFSRADGSTYITEAAHYLEQRGLTIQDTPILPYMAKNHGLQTAEGQPYLLEGWAYQIRDENTVPHDAGALLRVCNYPEFPLYYRDGSEFEDRPKFLHTGKTPWVYYTAARDRVTNAPTVTLHEKITSAALCHKILGVPSLAVSGCTGWSHHGTMVPELEKLIQAIMPDANLIVCFDGDMLSNSNIMLAASRLKACISTARPDIVVSFPTVPPNPHGVGWDDWGVGRSPDDWIAALSADGVDVQEVIPLAILVEQYGVSVGTRGTPQLEQTANNYLRLMAHPLWADIVVDYDESVYRGNTYYGTMDTLRNDVQMWLEYSICRGYGAGVSVNNLHRAIATWAAKRRGPVALNMLRATPDVSFETARAAAVELVNEGLRIVGPMTPEETTETILRCFRDIAIRWSDRSDRAAEDIQWIWSLIGPTGCGKSKYPLMLLQVLEDLGFSGARIGQLEKLGSRATFAEYSRIARDSLVAIADDYNANEHYARDMETELYTLTSSRKVAQRRLYKENAEACTLRAAYFLTTTDTNRQFIRNPEGSGERRFIPMEVRGHVRVHGMVVGNREVIERCGGLLLRWAAQRGEEDVVGDATEFSRQYVRQYIQQSNIVSEVAEQFTDWRAVEQKMEQWYRPGTNDYRFTGPMLSSILYAGKLTPAARRRIYDWFQSCGAAAIGQAKVNVEDGKEVRKDSVLCVQKDKLAAFIARLRAV